MPALERTKRCPYCSGSGLSSNPKSKDIRCHHCHGEAKVCILCIKPSSECECAEHRFDDDPTPDDPPVTQRF